MSISPGHTTKPAGTATTSAPSADKALPTCAMRSPSISTSCMPSMPLAGSTTRPPLSSFFMFRSASQQIEDGHTHRNAVGHLIENDRIGAIRHFRGNLDAPVHRTGMHDHHVRLGRPQPVFGHSEDVEIFPQRWKVRPFHAFELDPEQHDHVGVADRIAD